MSILVLQSSWWGKESWLIWWFFFLVSRDRCVALPRGAMGLSAVCDCGISWSYSLTISERRVIGLSHISINSTGWCVLHWQKYTKRPMDGEYRLLLYSQTFEKPLIWSTTHFLWKNWYIIGFDKSFSPWWHITIVRRLPCAELQQQPNLGRRFGTSKMHLSPHWLRLLSVLRRWFCCCWLVV